jgi:hypothetical protein
VELTRIQHFPAILFRDAALSSCAATSVTKPPNRKIVASNSISVHLIFFTEIHIEAMKQWFYNINFFLLQYHILYYHICSGAWSDCLAFDSSI